MSWRTGGLGNSSLTAQVNTAGPLDTGPGRNRSALAIDWIDRLRRIMWLCNIKSNRAGWIQIYMEQQQESSFILSGSIGLHRIFYAATLLVFLIMFHWGKQISRSPCMYQRVFIFLQIRVNSFQIWNMTSLSDLTFIQIQQLPLQFSVMRHYHSTSNLPYQIIIYIYWHIVMHLNMPC